jgi:16S rRNA (adenine1518-N6/adenine1519-N6)-dimethyltransferase
MKEVKEKKLGHAKKSLGQNFLHEETALNKIIEAGNLTKKDTVLEIGPGRGALTKKLLATGATIVAVEKDRELIPYLSELFAKEIKNKKLILIEDDVLVFNPVSCKLSAGNYKLIANIPYYITGAIVRKFLSSDHQPSAMVILVQDEVARRVTTMNPPQHQGKPAPTKESLLSLSVKAYGTPRYVAKVSRGSFTPAPKVDSAILAIEHISKGFFGKTRAKGTEELFFEVLHAGFAHKRKVLISNLKQYSNHTNLEAVFTELALDKNTRAEDVPLETWLSLCKHIQTR